MLRVFTYDLDSASKKKKIENWFLPLSFNNLLYLSKTYTFM